MSDGGKGSAPRPYSVDHETFDSNWNKIFNRKKPTVQEQFDSAVMQNEYYEQDNDSFKE